MSVNRQVEVFSAGCPCCEKTIEQVQDLAASCCEITVRDMHNPDDAQRAAELGVHSVPAVAVDGKLAGCCSNRGPQEAELRAAGIVVPK